VVVVRTVALDVHKRFAEVAIHENGALRRLGRIETGQLGLFAQSLGPGDHVVLESTAAMTWAIAELLAEHAGRVTVSNPMRTRAIASAKVKTDKIDAKLLARLGAADFLPEVWAPMKRRGRCGAGSRIAPAWWRSARGCATRCTRCWRAI
jgi:transposase